MTGFFARSPKPVGPLHVERAIDDAGPTVDLSDSPRSRYEESGDLARGGRRRYDWGYGAGILRGQYDYASEHAAIIRALVMFGPNVREQSDRLRAERATLDEFDFNAYPRAVPTWTEDHPPWWIRMQRGHW